jgi:protein-S-isoprenylcysteine O-methyltransferase Ste14
MIRLLDLHRELEATPWGQRLLANVWPAYLFAMPLLVRAWNLEQRIQVGGWGDSLHAQALLLQEFVTVAFLALTVLLFIVRRPVVGRHANWRGGLVALVGTFLLNVVGFLPVESSASTTAVLASSVVIVLGTVFTMWSLATLGRCFGLMPEARGLVTGGPYRWVRHPVYLGELTSAFGMLIVKPHPLIVGLYALFVGLQYWRTTLEEAALAEAFPADYPAYRARVARLLPGWRRAS